MRDERQSVVTARVLHNALSVVVGAYGAQLTTLASELEVAHAALVMLDGKYTALMRDVSALTDAVKKVVDDYGACVRDLGRDRSEFHAAMHAVAVHVHGEDQQVVPKVVR